MTFKVNSHIKLAHSINAPLLKAAEWLLPATGTHYKISEIAGKTLKGEQLNHSEPSWKTALKTLGCILAFPLALAALAIKVHAARTYRFEPIQKEKVQEQKTAATAPTNEIQNMPHGTYITSEADLALTLSLIGMHRLLERDKFPETPEEFLELQSLPSTKNILHRMVAETGDVIDLVDQKDFMFIQSMLRITNRKGKGCYYYGDAFNLQALGAQPEKTFSHFLGTWLEKNKEQKGPLFISYGAGMHARLLVFEQGNDPMDVTCINIDSFGSDSLPNEIKELCKSCFRAMKFEHSTLKQQTDGHKCYTWSLLNMFHLIRNLPASPRQLVKEGRLARIDELEGFQKRFVEEHKRIAAEIKAADLWD